MELWKELAAAGCFADGRQCLRLDRRRRPGGQRRGGHEPHGHLDHRVPGTATASSRSPTTTSSSSRSSTKACRPRSSGPSTAWSPRPMRPTPRPPWPCSRPLRAGGADGLGCRPGRPAPQRQRRYLAVQQRHAARPSTSSRRAETYNFNYDLATPPAPSEVGLGHVPGVPQRPQPTSTALLARPRRPSRLRSRTSSSRPRVTDGPRPRRARRRGGARALVPALSTRPRGAQTHAERDERMTRGSRVSLFLMAAGPLAFYAIFVLLPLLQSM